MNIAGEQEETRQVKYSLTLIFAELGPCPEKSQEDIDVGIQHVCGRRVVEWIRGGS